MVDALLVWLLVLGLGLGAVPFADLLFPRLPSCGRVFARPLGVVLVAYPVWLLVSLGLIDYSRRAALLSLACFGVAAGALRRWAPRRPAGPIGIWVAGEVLFTIAFSGFVLLRAYAPDIWQTEKPMDMALVNVVNRAVTFPPHDPWLGGADVNYYYFGHYLVAFLIRVSGVDPSVGFNLAVGLFFALATATVFGVAAVLYDAARKRGAPARSPIVVGLVAATFATVLGNLAGGFQLLRHLGSVGTYDWWSPSRVIEGTANEFPAFSFLLADLHAHVMATPFTLVVVAYAIQLAAGGPPARTRRLALGAELLLASVVLGSLYAINSFDFPTACAILLAALGVWGLDGSGRHLAAAGWAAASVIAAGLLFLPFWIHFSPPTKGIALVADHTQFSDFLSGYWSIYGLFVWVALAVFAAGLRAPRRYLAWSGALALFLLVLLSPPRLAGLAVALTVAALAGFFAFASGAVDATYRFLWVLLAVALSLVAVGELVYVRDVFEGTASFRFNTVFKTGYQAWYLLAIVAGVSVFWSRAWLSTRVRNVWLVGLACLVALGLAYPLAAGYSRSGGFKRPPTLDGMQWLERTAPADAAAIRWLRRSIEGNPTILEAVGADFNAEGRGRVSTFTGLPALIQWPGHEVQWGHQPDFRARDADVIFRTTDPRVAVRLLTRYDVRLVFVGSLERNQYSPDALDKFGRLGRVVFRSGRTIVYRVAREGAAL